MGDWFRFLLVNHHWCGNAARLIWRSPFFYSEHQCIVQIYLTYLNPQEREELKLNGVVVPPAVTSTYFYYPLFLRGMDMKALDVSIRDWMFYDVQPPQPEGEVEAEIIENIQGNSIREDVNSNTEVSTSKTSYSGNSFKKDSKNSSQNILRTLKNSKTNNPPNFAHLVAGSIGDDFAWHRAVKRALIKMFTRLSPPLSILCVDEPEIFPLKDEQNFFKFIAPVKEISLVFDSGWSDIIPSLSRCCRNLQIINISHLPNFQEKKEESLLDFFNFLSNQKKLVRFELKNSCDSHGSIDLVLGILSQSLRHLAFQADDSVGLVSFDALSRFKRLETLEIWGEFTLNERLAKPFVSGTLPNLRKMEVTGLVEVCDKFRQWKEGINAVQS
ncbi:hypothetical protein G9A89_003787 [Geosiphon pyriformis]|nr:hypothetical protein G9A89_003787 [Geosiphon pyriformis]